MSLSRRSLLRFIASFNALIMDFWAFLGSAACSWKIEGKASFLPAQRAAT